MPNTIKKISYYFIKSKNKYAILARRISFYLLILLIWQSVCLAGIWPEYLFPGPFQVFSSLWEGLKEGIIEKAALVSLRRILIGYAISLAIGLLLGVLMARIRIIDETIGSLVLGIQALPSVCWLPLAIIWFGLNDKAIIFVVVMGALFSITIGVETGIKNTSPQFIRAAKTLGAKGFSMYANVVIPAALPSILSGLRQGWSFAWRSLMAGELLFFSLSLGNLLQTGRDLNDASQVIAIMFVIMLTGSAVDRFVFNPLLRRTREKWGLDNQ